MYSLQMKQELEESLRLKSFKVVKAFSKTDNTGYDPEAVMNYDSTVTNTMIKIATNKFL